ncbi:MAG: SsrA-binding protein SmpB [Methylacidiphilales bacterium]|nr:SsrA-binding protein SmpB [Candidatus Methylacidiphilales bacterium]MDW8348795.1 SsrA-binding protein SmpB [Verrucomicrobiae bacterium]
MEKEIATNRKAYRDYKILETVEAGIVLRGTEVKSIRQGHVQIDGAFVRIEKNQAYLWQAKIEPYENAAHDNHEPLAPRKLLLRRSQIQRLYSQSAIKGRTLVALKMYWKNNYVKVLIALAQGKQQHDKRAELKKAEAEREIARRFRRSS